MSYLSHFNLQEQPFRLTPDPDFIYWSKQHARAKAYMESTIWLADGFVVITGEIGSGKTTLLQSFLSELEDDVVYAVVSQTQLTPTQFLQAVLTEFGFKPFNKRKVELLDMLNMFLIEQYSNGKKVVLIVRDSLNSPGLKQLVQRVRLRFHLGPLDRREMHEYIDHRLGVAGAKTRLFEEDAFETIHVYTGGVPRLINTLCDSALLCAFADEKSTIGRDDVMAAVTELNWKEHESNTGIYEKLQQIQQRETNSSDVTRIEIRNNGEVVQELTLPLGRVIIGRSSDNEIFVQSKFVSRHHAQLVSDENGCVIEDLNSTNGVFLGEKQIKKYRLRDGDVVSLGVYELVYHDLRQPETVLQDQLDTRPDDETDDQDSAVNEQRG
jgi:type II secretory pathway predicted ATPase ExeA